jgi:hypothetical protein
VIFEENSGLSEVLPVDVIDECIEADPTWAQEALPVSDADAGAKPEATEPESAAAEAGHSGPPE